MVTNARHSRKVISATTAVHLNSRLVSIPHLVSILHLAQARVRSAGALSAAPAPLAEFDVGPNATERHPSRWGSPEISSATEWHHLRSRDGEAAPGSAWTGSQAPTCMTRVRGVKWGSTSAQRAIRTAGKRCSGPCIVPNRRDAVSMWS